MKKPISSIVVLSLIITAIPAFAQNSAITRRDAFIRIWETIRRPVGAIHTVDFTDVKEGDRGYGEITYAKSRKILGGTEFHPDEPLIYQDALLMLFRTRNVDDNDKITVDTLPDLLKKYPIFGSDDRTFGDTVTSDALEKLISDLDQKLRDEIHETSMYSEKFQGKGTAFGESFDMNAMTAAHRTFPYNTLVRVTNVSNGKSVIVRINDRGPYVSNRDMDMSLASFLMIEERAKGKTNVRFERLGDISMVNADGTPMSASSASSTSSSSSVAACTVRSRVVSQLFPNVHLNKKFPVRLALTDSVRLSSDAMFTVTRVRGPDGTVKDLKEAVSTDHEFSFTPATKGWYVFSFSSPDGARKNLRMNVVPCSH